MPPSQVPQSPTNNDSGSTVVDRSPPVENYDEDCPLLSSTNSNNATTTVATHPSNAFNFFSVALLNRDKQRDHIRFHQLPDALEPIMTELIRIWGGRKHISKSSSKSIEYQLAYDAWSEFRTDTNAIWARSLLIEIMKRFAFHGWDFALGMEISKMMRGKDVLFFEKGIADTEVHIFCINFPKSDRIKVIGATPEVINGIGQVIQVTWPGGLQKGEFGAYKSFEFKVRNFRFELNIIDVHLIICIVQLAKNCFLG